jgi:hypothetical protein
MNDKQLEQIQNELMKNLDDESRLEDHIKQSSETIASYLMGHEACNIDINNIPFRIKYKLLDMKNGNKLIYMLAANMTKYRITPEKYVPFSISANVDEQYSLQDNLKAVAEGFVRHITGRIKPDMLEE